MLNFMALLGWSIGADRTIFSIEDAIAAFDLGAVSKNPAVFDIDKLAWINGEYMRAMDPGAFARHARPLVEAELGRSMTPDETASFTAMVPLVQERTKLLTDVADQMRFLFTDDLHYDEHSWSKVMEKEEVPGVLDEARTRLESVDTFEVDSIEATLRGMLEDLGIGARKGLQPLRVAVTGSSVSPPLFESMAALGREVTLARIDAAREKL
jgi:glutamyl-tRNA synthetase